MMHEEANRLKTTQFDFPSHNRYSHNSNVHHFIITTVDACIVNSQHQQNLAALNVQILQKFLLSINNKTYDIA